MAKSTARLALATEAPLSSGISAQMAEETPATVVPVRTGVVIKSDRAMPATTKGKASAYPWLSLEVGQSFFVAGAKVESFWSMCAEKNKANPDKRFKACRFTEDGVNGVGVWRVA